MRHDASAEHDTTSAAEAYGRFPPRQPAEYRESWLPQALESK
jgi:hypothetical protein